MKKTLLYVITLFIYTIFINDSAKTSASGKHASKVVLILKNNNSKKISTYKSLSKSRCSHQKRLLMKSFNMRSNENIIVLLE